MHKVCVDCVEGLGCLAQSTSMLLLHVGSRRILRCQLCLVSFWEGNCCVTPEGASQQAFASRDQSLEMKQEGIQAASVHPLPKIDQVEEIQQRDQVKNFH